MFQAISWSKHVKQQQCYTGIFHVCMKDMGSGLMKDGNSFQFFLLIFACLPVNLFFVLHKKYKTLESQP